MNKTVSILRCRDYDIGLLEETVEKAWQLCGGKDVLDVEGKSVLLKPNILSDAPVEKSVTTHPEFVRAVIRFVKKHGASKVYVGDSPGFQKPGFRGKNCGVWDVCRDEGAEWYDFAGRTTVLNVPEGRMCNQFVVSDIVEKADLIISLPKMKTHQLMYFTGAIKNQFGLIPGLSKSPYHMLFPSRKNFAQMLVDLHTALKPAFAFMDGVIAMDGPGPGNGSPFDAGLVLASSNLLALDVTACRIIGYDPDIIPVNRDAIDRGLWLESSKDPEIRGLSLEEAVLENFQKIKLTGSKFQLLEFLTPGFIKRLIEESAPRPVFLEKSCIRCGECVRICPADALGLIPGNGRNPEYDEMIAIDYSKCIRCFCCHEVCPADAIEVKRAPFRKSDL